MPRPSPAAGSWLVVLCVPAVLAAVALTLLIPTAAPARQMVSLAAFGQAAPPPVSAAVPQGPALLVMAPAAAAVFARGLMRFSAADLAAQAEALRATLAVTRPGPLAQDLTDALTLTEAEAARRS